MSSSLQKNTKADCYGQKFGHDYAGGVCLKCGGEQNPFKKLDSFSRVLWSGLENRIRRKVNTRIHSELHELVDKARKDFGETATKGKGSFGFYLRMLKRVPTSTIYQWLIDIKDSPKLNTPLSRAKVFWWKYKQWKHPVDKPEK